MKSLIKRALKPAWRATLPIRRPIAARVEAFLRRCLVPPPAGPPIELAEMSVALDHVVRELVRLQDQVESLREAIDDLNADGLRERSPRHPNLSASAA